MFIPLFAKMADEHPIFTRLRQLKASMETMQMQLKSAELKNAVLEKENHDLKLQLAHFARELNVRARVHMLFQRNLNLEQSRNELENQRNTAYAMLHETREEYMDDLMSA